MKNIKLLVTILLFPVLLTGCGMKGPLYRAPVKPAAAPITVDKKEPREQSTTAQEKTQQQNLDKSAQ